jgi:hypothetical protein
MAMKKKGYRNGGKVKKMMKGGAAGGKMTVAQLRAAAKEMGYKVTKDSPKKKK